MKELLILLIQTRRKARRAEFAVATLRLEGARARKAKDPGLGKFLERLADLIERHP